MTEAQVVLFVDALLAGDPLALRALDDCDGAIAELEARASRQLDVILHHPSFRALESTWIGDYRSRPMAKSWKVALLAAGVVGAVAGGYLLTRGDGAGWPSRPSWKRSATCAEMADCEPRCEQGDGFACLRAAAWYDQGRGVARDPARAQALRQLGCDHGEGGACSVLGDKLSRAKDEEGARKWWEQGLRLDLAGCDQGNADDCRSAWYTLAAGNGEADYGKDDDKARALRPKVLSIFTKFCDEGDAGACRWAGSVTKGIGDADKGGITRALPFYQRACDLDPAEHCWELGFYQQQVGQNGRAAIERECEASRDGNGCWDPAAPKDVGLAKKSAPKWKARCKEGVRDACIRLADLDAEDRDNDIRPASEKAAHRATVFALLRQECDRGLGDACSDLAFRLGGKNAVGAAGAEVPALLKKACAAQDEYSCRALEDDEIADGIEELWTGAYNHCARRRGKFVCWGLDDVGQLGVPRREKSDWKPLEIALGTATKEAAHDVPSPTP